MRAQPGSLQPARLEEQEQGCEAGVSWKVHGSPAKAEPSGGDASSCRTWKYEGQPEDRSSATEET